MQSGEFGHGRVPMQQSHIDEGSFRKASMMTGANPVSPARQSYQSTDRQVNAGSIPNRANSNQHFFSSTARGNASFQAGRNESNFNRGGGNPSGNAVRGPSNSEPSRPPQSMSHIERSFTPQSSTQGQAVQSSRPGWRPFTPPGGSQNQSGGRTFEGQGTSQPRTNTYSQPAGPSSRPYEYNTGGRTVVGPGTPQPRTNTYSQPAAPPSRQYENNSRGSFNGYGSSRPTLNMQQPVVTPRGGGSYSGRPMPSAPSGGGYHGAPSGGGSRGGNPGGGSHGGSSGGGHSHR